MTVHSAKGLEAPLVFLADSSYESREKNSNTVIVEWPVEDQFPGSFLLASKSDFMPDHISKQFKNENKENICEDNNLLYVAVTRARQHLFISGSQPRRSSSLGWYARIALQHQLNLEELEEPVVLAESGTPTEITQLPETKETLSIDERNLTGPFQLTSGYREIAPSRSSSQQHETAASDEDAKTRGIVIHLMLEKLSEQPSLSLQQFKKHLQLAATQTELEEYWQEAQLVLNDQGLRKLFDPEHYDKAYNEVSVIYNQNGATVHGIIDRLILDKDTVSIIDYKTHRTANKNNLVSLSQSYQEQMALYVQGVKKLWPEHHIEAYLLFTHCAGLQKMSL
jgi:ATP-dependent helicase/nuclease subunit A